MSDLLDTHEISTNNDSQEMNFSINQSNLNFGEENVELEKNVKIDPRFLQKLSQMKQLSMKKENKILLSQENLLTYKKKP